VAGASNTWRTSKDVRARTGLIGPNAVLQYLPVLERLGADQCAQILARASIAALPDGTAMIPEADAARLHRQVRKDEPGLAPQLARQAGAATADYILAHRIPGPAQVLLKALPARPSARLLSQAIAKHAWTFVGSSRFDVIAPDIFQITDNPLIAGEQSDTCLCHWHAAVFARLYRVLVAPDYTCTEVTCGAQGVGVPCRFELSRAANLTEIKARAAPAP